MGELHATLDAVGMAGTTPVAGVADLPTLLLASPDGLTFIHRAAAAVAQVYGTSQLTIRVDSPAVGPQVFFHPADPGPDRGTRIAEGLARSPGLVAEPSVVPAAIATQLVALATLALRLDLLAHDAAHDALTGVANRRTFEEMLDGAVARAERHGWPFVLALIDLDDFKSVNDRWGHDVGDSVLQSFGAAMRARLRSGDLAARLGGDEFALLLVGPVRPEEILDQLSTRLHAALQAALPDAGLHCSIGVARFPDDASDARSLIRRADERLYADKCPPTSI